MMSWNISFQVTCRIKNVSYYFFYWIKYFVSWFLSSLAPLAFVFTPFCHAHPCFCCRDLPASWAWGIISNQQQTQKKAQVQIRGTSWHLSLWKWHLNWGRKKEDTRVTLTGVGWGGVGGRCLKGVSDAKEEEGLQMKNHLAFWGKNPDVVAPRE